MTRTGDKAGTIVSIRFHWSAHLGKEPRLYSIHDRNYLRVLIHSSIIRTLFYKDNSGFPQENKLQFKYRCQGDDKGKYFRKSNK